MSCKVCDRPDEQIPCPDGRPGCEVLHYGCPVHDAPLRVAAPSRVPIASDAEIAARARVAMIDAITRHAAEHPTRAIERVEIVPWSPDCPTPHVAVTSSGGGSSRYPIATVAP